jgi:hypothetical protein
VLAVVPAAAANVPATQTFKPAELGVSFTLPSDWAGGATGLRFEAVGPGRVAQLDIAAAATTLPFATVKAKFVTAQRQRLAKASGASLTSRTVTVGSAPAVEVITRYQGLGIYAPGEIREYIYAFEHGGMFFIVAYSTTSDWTAKEKPIFDASIRSFRLANVA